MKIKVVIFFYRLSNFIYLNCKFNWLKFFLIKIISFFKFIIIDIPFGIEIPYECIIGKNLRLVHLNGIVISKYTTIGNNCTILHQVTIGVNDKKDSRKAAIIGDNCFIGAGAKIIGNVVIGNNVTIGANAVVTKNIPDNSTVVGFNKIINNTLK